MRKSVKAISMALGLMVLSTTPSLAVDWQWSSGQRNITQVQWAYWGIVFKLDGAVINANASCGGLYFKRKASDPNYYTAVSTILTAHAQGKTVSVLFDADDTTCHSPINLFNVW